MLCQKQYDAGKEVRCTGFTGNAVKIERDGLTSGVYFYQLVAGDRPLCSGKFIVD